MLCCERLAGCCFFFGIFYTAFDIRDLATIREQISKLYVMYYVVKRKY